MERSSAAPIGIPAEPVIANPSPRGSVIVASRAVVLEITAAHTSSRASLPSETLRATLEIAANAACMSSISLAWRRASAAWRRWSMTVEFTTRPTT